ncbi:uncharacterized protein EDB91DRAFT_1158986 [Suillus paluster]|uniref:uncharacterized protein n=1 Tax=Suillus paluster TaxID=48578 RepID=UPI001B88554A|nr:uncharacterized protein EDB91DRAFT_1158986 [Suillus paluster]KAG1729613.1 hypothetical protein EDB91DRAFT_1158986 [Suillus paluster]
MAYAQFVVLVVFQILPIPSYCVLHLVLLPAAHCQFRAHPNHIKHAAQLFKYLNRHTGSLIATHESELLHP